ncbi:MAG: amidohydrolase family protein, partial [Anaerolineaceae bacterium]|nr:amidohydrolase family protein [Anaerolineaceae bacterium]
MSKTILFANGKIYSKIKPHSNSLLIEDGQIKFLGDLQEARKSASSQITEIDLSGKFILPGLCDFHLHLAYTAEKLDAVDCETDSLGECLARVATKTQNAPADDWIIGYGWNHNVWQPADYGTAAQLDAVSANHPVFLHAKSLHAAWVNTMAMRIAGIDRNTPDPEGGVIMRNEYGEPNGILLENAASLVFNHLPEPNTEQVAKKILRAQSHLHSLGLTAVHDFDRR